METVKEVLQKIKQWSLNYESDADFILRMESEYKIILKRKYESEETCN
jgi:phage protein D